jgi:hypothetical protein
MGVAEEASLGAFGGTAIGPVAKYQPSIRKI